MSEAQGPPPSVQIFGCKASVQHWRVPTSLVNPSMTRKRQVPFNAAPDLPSNTLRGSSGRYAPRKGAGAKVIDEGALSSKVVRAEKGVQLAPKLSLLAPRLRASGTMVPSGPI